MFLRQCDGISPYELLPYLYQQIFIKMEILQKSAIYVARKAKVGAGKNVQKYGFWGLLLFVMVPIPEPGCMPVPSPPGYLASRKRAFMANVVGVYLSCVIVWTITILTVEGIN